MGSIKLSLLFCVCFLISHFSFSSEFIHTFSPYVFIVDESNAEPVTISFSSANKEAYFDYSKGTFLPLVVQFSINGRLLASSYKLSALISDHSCYLAGRRQKKVLEDVVLEVDGNRIYPDADYGSKKNEISYSQGLHSMKVTFPLIDHESVDYCEGVIILIAESAEL